MLSINNERSAMNRLVDGDAKKKKKNNRKMIVSWDKITGNCFQRVKALQDRVFFALRTAQVIVAKKMVWSRD